MNEDQNTAPAAGEQSNAEQMPSAESNVPLPVEDLTKDLEHQSSENIANQTTTDSPTMEVHHPHHPTHKKKWSDYLLEFFMLFLAVFLRFLVENFREHKVELERGRKAHAYTRALD